jgi:protoporphyrinogen IX oxidase
MAELYPWFKAAHVIFVIFWMAGLFMLPRMMVYQQEAALGSAEDALYTTRIQSLRRIILTPALIVVWIMGLTLAWQIGVFSGGAGNGWFHAKLLLVILLSGYHGWMVGYSKKLARGERTMAGKTLRLVNEVPAIVAILAVILVIVKPF